METTEITIKILAEDIKTSIYVNNKDCAIARAIKRSIPNIDIRVDCMSITNEIDRTWVQTPELLEYEVYAMYAYLSEDKHVVSDALYEKEPQDFEFTLTVPKSWIK